MVSTEMKKILVIRNDKIGDFMLAWPICDAEVIDASSSYLLLYLNILCN